MLHVTPDSDAAALLVAEQVDEVLARVAKPVLMLPTGSTPKPLYALWRQRFQGGGFSMAHCRTFNLDEYWPCSTKSPISFRAFMDEELFSQVDLPPNAIGFLDGTVKEPDFETHCAAYERAIVDAGGLDICLLGVGVNGHIAFNEPGTPADSRTRLVRLAESTRKRPGFPQGVDAPTAGISVGIQTILDARKVIVMAFGADKAHAVKRALEGPVSIDTPASLLRSHSNVTWVLDEAAASALQGR
ncbi:MAG: glucosamine-6-phosphate deaminase [Planctomycetota bacterium]|jgi:glucosamine-6-phosphate deaminase|nr:glucosamine-6-phosphate deaminase [Planctomycetota bacterium]